MISLVIALIPAGPKRPHVELLAVAVVALIAASRIYLRAHWFPDTAAGAALGAAVAVATASIIHRMDDRRRGESHREHDRTGSTTTETTRPGTNHEYG